MIGTKQAAVTTAPRRWSRFFVLALLLIATYFLVQTLAPQTIGETARRKLLTDLRAHYPGREVTIRRCYFDPRIGLTFEDVQVGADTTRQVGADTTRQVGADTTRDGVSGIEVPKIDGAMVRIERLTVLTNVHPEKLLDGNVPLVTRGIVLDGVEVTTWLNENQQLSLMDLMPLPKFGPPVPRMIIRNVRFNLVNGVAHRRPITAKLDDIDITNTQGAGDQVDRVIVVRGSTDFADKVLLRVDMVGDTVDVRSTVQGMHISHDLFARLPAVWARQVRHAEDLQCDGDATCALRRSSDGSLNYHLRATIHDGRLGHPMLPKPISEMRGVVSCTPQGIKIEASQGMFGDAVVRVAGSMNGYSWPCKTSFNVSARGLLLDDRLAYALPAATQTAWNRLQPTGRIDADAEMSYSDSGWKSTASVVCKGVDVRYERFPYPVESLVGRIEIDDGVARADTLSGRVGGNWMQCAFQLPVQPGVVAEKSFVIAVDGPIPIDKTLLGALSPRGSDPTRLESFVRSLRPRGSVQLTSAVFRTDRNGSVSKRLDLRVIDGHLRYEKFAYPLYNVTGNIVVDNDLVTIDGMRANNANAGTILCDGSYRIPNPTGIQYSDALINPYVRANQEGLWLRFRANDVPMDESLRSSLPPDSQPVWDALSPSGVLDRLEVVLEQPDIASPLHLNFTANQIDNPQVTSRSLSLRPNSLPYRLDVTGGMVHFDGKTVTIDSLKGRHDASTLDADGYCVQDSNGRWQLLLNLHSGSRLHPDAELIAALPSQMRVGMRALQLRGPVSVRGQTRISMPDAIHPEPAIHWDLVLQLEGNRIGDVGPVHSLRGELSIQGQRDEEGIRALGSVLIDSMHVHDIQITGIRGPFSVEGDMLYLGGYTHQTPARQGNSNPNQVPSIRGRLFDGSVDLDGRVVLSSGNFGVGLSLQNAQLPTLLADFGHSDKDLTGTFSGQTQLQGNLGTTDLLKGSGAGRLSEANLYKLPLIVQVLNLLRVKATPDVAFTDGELEFSLFGDTVTFNDLQVWGDLVALQGGGTLNRRRELDLTFNTRVSPQNSFTQLIRPLGQRYTLGTIAVHGPLHALEIERKTLDQFSETFEWLIPGRPDQASSRQETPTIRSWFD